MKYHINYDGKILPCRAKVKACPYGLSRHSDSYEDLYYKFQDKYNHVNPSPELLTSIHAGNPLHGVKDFDEEIADSDSPMELICSTYKEAITYAGCASLTDKEQEKWKWAVDMIRRQYDAGQGVPNGIPDELIKEGQDAFQQKHSLNPFFHANKRLRATDGNWQRLIDAEPELKKLAIKRTQGYQMTKQERLDYQQEIHKDFNRYANLLNTRKMISQPMVTSENIDEIQSNFEKLSDEELLSIYDDSTVSDREIERKLDEVNHFNFAPIDQLSDKANANLQRWFDSAKQAENRYIIGSSRRTLIALTAAQVLYDRNKNYGDLIYTVMEK